MYYQPQIDFKPEEVLLYSRKSRTDDPLLTVEEVLEKHEKILDEWAEKYLGAKVPEVNKFREVLSAETLDGRPEALKVLSLMESPKYKAILIVEVQRLSRGDLEDAGRLIKLLRYTNTIVITPQKTYDLRDEYDRDAFERELKRGNEFLEYQKKIMSRGRLLSVQQGNFIGNKAPYGYDKLVVKEGKRTCHTLAINETEAAVVRMIFDMYVTEDLGRVTIARRLNEMHIPTRTGALWSQDTIKRMLDNEHYLGKVRWNWRQTINVVEEGEIRKVRPQNKVGEYLVYDGKHPAIISEELFKAAAAKKGRNHRTKGTAKVRNPLVGLLFCKCGRAMSLRTYKNNGVERSAPRLLCDNQAYCGTTSALYSEVIDQVKVVLQNCIKDFEIRIKGDNKDSQKLHENLIKRLKAKMEELNQTELRQWEKYSMDGMPKHIFETLNAKVLAEKEEVQQALCKAYESMPEPVDYEDKLLHFTEALKAIDDPSITAQKKNSLLKGCIERIDYSREKAVRSKSKQVRVYDPALKKTVSRSPLNTGGSWDTKPIELNVKLKV